MENRRYISGTQPGEPSTIVEEPPAAPQTPSRPGRLRSLAELSPSLRPAPYRYGMAIGLVLAAAAVRLAFLQVLGTRAAFVTFYPAVMLAGLYGGLRAGLVATLLSALVADYFWLEPRGFGIDHPGDWVALAVFLVGCTMICAITEAMHRARARATAAEAEVKIATERKRAEEEIRELSQRLSYHVDHSPLAVIEWGPDMRLIRWSREAERLFGWKAAEVLGKRMEDFRWIYLEDERQVAEVSADLTKGTNPHRFSAMKPPSPSASPISWATPLNSPKPAPNPKSTFAPSPLLPHQPLLHFIRPIGSFASGLKTTASAFRKMPSRGSSACSSAPRPTARALGSAWPSCARWSSAWAARSVSNPPKGKAAASGWTSQESRPGKACQGH